METKARYGYYGITPYVVSLGVFVVAGICIWGYGARSGSDLSVWLGLLLLAYGVFSTAGWLLVRYVVPGSPVNVARKLLSSLTLRGDEQILDAGTGRGLYAIEAAKLLTTGKVIAIDVWETDATPNLIHQHKWARPTRSCVENARRNAELEGVQSKIEFRNMDVNALSFEAARFDVAICAFVIGHLGQHAGTALSEIGRVLKPGGRLVIIDNVRDPAYVIMSTPHLFILSYLRGKKAKRLTKKNWSSMLSSAGFEIQSMKLFTAFITLHAKVEKKPPDESRTVKLQ